MRERGFTLLEMLVAIGVFGVILAGVMSLLYESQWAYQSQGPMNRSAGQARIAMDQLVRYIRHAGNDPFDFLKTSGIPAVEILGDNHVRLNSDITGAVVATTRNSMQSTGDPDGSLSSLQERVEFRYERNSRRLMMNLGGGEVTLADNIAAFQLSYFDAAGVETTDPTSIVRIRIRLVAESERPDLRTGLRNEVVLHSDVFLRSKVYSPFEELETSEERTGSGG